MSKNISPAVERSRVLEGETLEISLSIRVGADAARAEVAETDGEREMVHRGPGGVREHSCMHVRFSGCHLCFTGTVVLVPSRLTD